MGIETSDVTYTTWVHDPNPVPLPETNGFEHGPPRFLVRNMDEPIFRTVGQSFSYHLKVAGRRPIKVTMDEVRFDEKETIKELAVAIIDTPHKGVTFSIRNLSESMRGQHTFMFEASNQGGRPRAKIYLIVQGRNSSG